MAFFHNGWSVNYLFSLFFVVYLFLRIRDNNPVWGKCWKCPAVFGACFLLYLQIHASSIPHVEPHDDIFTSNYKHVFLTPLVRRMSHLHHYLLRCEPKLRHDQLPVHSLFLSWGNIKNSSAIVSIASYMHLCVFFKEASFLLLMVIFFMYKATDKSVNRKSTPCSLVENWHLIDIWLNNLSAMLY